MYRFILNANLMIMTTSRILAKLRQSYNATVFLFDKIFMCKHTY